MPNGLASSLSPYLLQHADNPVDWMPWGEEAFARATELDRPIFLSIGYSSCHWCHVMAHESFEDPEVAEALNRSFVSVKVDREERPDVDDAYMLAAQTATGHGGWPLTIFMTPSGDPFFAGTYFPKEGRGQAPGFTTIVSSLSQAWEQDRDAVRKAAAEFAEALSKALASPARPTGGSLDLELLDATVEVLHEGFDFEHGGFGGAPKFPPHTTLAFLREYARLRPGMGDATVAGSLIGQAEHMFDFTLDRMAMGGVHDVVGGGFHRYSTDERWHLPHFEKMLYDNALLLGLLPAGQAADGIESWLTGDLLRKDGTLASARDADSGGGEGGLYLWRAEELRSLLGDRFEEFAESYQIAEDGNFLDEATKQRTGESVLHSKRGVAPHPEMLERLAEARKSREQPMLDDKAVALWNALAILARPGADWATACLGAWRAQYEAEGHLSHVLTRGVSGGLGFADDYFGLALAAFEAGDTAFGERLLDEGIELFGDPRSGDFFSTSERHEKLFGRYKPGLDTPVPSANGLAAQALIRAERWDEAERTLAAGLGWMQRAGGSAGALLTAAVQFLAAGRQAAPVVVPKTKVTARLINREPHTDEEGWAHTAVVIEIPEGMHINTNEPPAMWLEATALKVEGALGEAAFPPSDDDQYREAVSIPLRLRCAEPPQEFEITLRFQACSETECGPPDEIRMGGVVLPRG